MAEQTKQLDNRLNENSKSKTAALQEASFYRVKLAAYEAASVSEVNKLEKQRISDLENKLSELIVSKTASDRQVAQLTNELEQERNLREVSQENTSRSNERSDQIQALHSQLVIDYEELLNKTRGMDMHSTESVQQYQSLQNTHRTVLAELESSKKKLESTLLANEKYLLTLQHHQKLMDATRSKVDEVQSSWDQAKSDLEAQKTLARDLHRELDSKLQELEQSKAKVEEMDQVIRRLQEENETLKTLHNDGISQLLHVTRSMPNEMTTSINVTSNDDVSQTRSLSSDIQHTTTTTTTTSEVDHNKRGQQEELSRRKLESTVLELNEARSRNMSLEVDLMKSKSEISTLRTKMMNLMSESNKIRSQISVKDHELQDKSRLIEASEVKTSLLKNLISENGHAGVTTDEDHGSRSFDSNGGGPVILGNSLLSSVAGNSNGSSAGEADRMHKRVQELEVQLEDRLRAHGELEQQYEKTQKEMQLAEGKYHEAHRKHEAAADEIASLVEEVQRLRSGGATSVSPASVEGNNNNTTNNNNNNGKVEEELQTLQEKHRTLEQTHVKAVQYVKGTEKMLRRMKDEIIKYKERTSSLESELSALKRGGDPSALSGTSHSTSTATAMATEESNKQEMRDSMKEKLAELTQQLTTLRESSRTSLVENEELQRRMQVIRAEYETDMQRHTADKQAQIAALHDHLRALQKSNTALQTDLDRLLKENTRLNDLIKASKNSINRVIAADGGNPSSSGSGSSPRQANKLSPDLLDPSSSSSSSSSSSPVTPTNNPAHIKEISWLKKENAELQNRCQDAEAKVGPFLSPTCSLGWGTHLHDLFLLFCAGAVDLVVVGSHG
jgi:hypothetical protein